MKVFLEDGNALGNKFFFKIYIVIHGKVYKKMGKNLVMDRSPLLE